MHLICIFTAIKVQDHVFKHLEPGRALTKMSEVKEFKPVAFLFMGASILRDVEGFLSALEISLFSLAPFWLWTLNNTLLLLYF